MVFVVTNEERIQQFEKQNPPFMLYDHKDGSFSLGLPFTFLEGRYKNYGQEAFNRYAIKRGDPVKDGQFFTHGSGYEWETVFQKAFEQDNDLQRVDFDSEAGAFFCYADDLSLLEDFGSRFRTICEDQESFSSLVCQALSEAEQETEYHMDHNTVKYNIECRTRWSMEVITPEQHLHIEKGRGVELWKGRNIIAEDSISGNTIEVNAKDLLRYHVTECEEDYENHHILLRAEPGQNEVPAESVSM